MSTRAVSRWNRGEDPKLGKVSSALAAVAARGNSAAKADRDRAMGLVDEAVGLEPADDYSPTQTRMFRDQQRKLIQSAAQFQRDADEFSGKPVGNYDTTEPWVAREEARAKAEAEKAVQRQGVSAEDYWERNPESKRTASITDQDGNVRTMGVASLERLNQRDRQQAAADEQRQDGRRAEVVANYRNTLDRAEADQLSSRLGEKGIEITDSLTKADGTLDPNKARGLLSASTFQQWDDDKMLDRAAKDLERRTKRELRYLEQAQDGKFGVGAQTQAMSSENQQRAAKLRAGIDAGDNDRNSLSGPGAWRRFAETELNNSAKQNAAVQNLIQATNARTMSYQDLAKTFGVTMESLEKYLKDGVLSPEEAAEIFAQQSN
jgi:hypothetical protein